MANSDIDIASQALVMLGSTPISAFTEGDRGRACGILYPDLRDALIAEHPWRFCMTKSSQLSPLTGTPSTEWKYAFQMPSDLIGTAFSLYDGSEQGLKPNLDWQQFGRKIYANHTKIWIDYKQRPLEAEWPAHFVRLMALELAWNIAEPVTDDDSKKSYWYEVARGTPSEGGKGGYFRTATMIDSQGSPSIAFPAFDLIAHRHG